VRAAGPGRTTAPLSWAAAADGPPGTAAPAERTDASEEAGGCVIVAGTEVDAATEPAPRGTVDRFVARPVASAASTITAVTASQLPSRIGGSGQTGSGSGGGSSPKTGGAQPGRRQAVSATDRPRAPGAGGRARNAGPT